MPPPGTPLPGNIATAPPQAKDINANGDAVDRAIRRAVERALWVHKQLGNPVCAWRDGRVVWIQPDDIPVQKPRDD